MATQLFKISRSSTPTDSLMSLYGQMSQAKAKALSLVVFSLSHSHPLIICGQYGEENAAVFHHPTQTRLTKFPFSLSLISHSHFVMWLFPRYLPKKAKFWAIFLINFKHVFSLILPPNLLTSINPFFESCFLLILTHNQHKDKPILPRIVHSFNIFSPQIVTHTFLPRLTRSNLRILALRPHKQPKPICQCVFGRVLKKKSRHKHMSSILQQKDIAMANVVEVAIEKIDEVKSRLGRFLLIN